MALIDKKINSFAKPVTALADNPKMSAQELKEWFDSNSTSEVKSAINGLIDELVGSGGSYEIGDDTYGEGGNIRESIGKIRGEIQQVIMGQIPDGSIGEEKLEELLRLKIAEVENKAKIDLSDIVLSSSDVTTKLRLTTETAVSYGLDPNTAVINDMWGKVKKKLIATITSSQDWICPPEITKVDVLVIGGGSSGGYGRSTVSLNSEWDGKPGLAGTVTFVPDLTVVPGQNYSCIIGSGGVPTINSSVSVSGGASSFGDSVIAVGGNNSASPPIGGSGVNSNCGMGLYGMDNTTSPIFPIPSVSINNIPYLTGAIAASAYTSLNTSITFIGIPGYKGYGGRTLPDYTGTDATGYGNGGGAGKGQRAAPTDKYNKGGKGSPGIIEIYG